MYKLTRKEREHRRQLRGRYHPEPRWYAAMVHTDHEKRVRDWIDDELAPNGVDDAFIPVVEPLRNARARRTAKLLFNSYVFLRAPMNDRIYVPLCEHPRVFQVLGPGYRIPTPLDDAEIDRLRTILTADCNPEIVSSRNVGDIAEITAGMMAGIRGRVLAVNAREVKLEVTFSFLDMGNVVAVAVPRSDVRLRADARRHENTVWEHCNA